MLRRIGFVFLATCMYAEMCTAAINPVAGALTWTGAESGDWNTTELNWVDENGTAVAWTQGANAVFNESATTTTVTLVEDIVAASCMFTSKVYTVMGPHALTVPSVTVKQRKGRYLDADFRCPLVAPSGTLTKDGDGFVILQLDGTLSNDLHVAQGRWTSNGDVFGHDISVTVDANAMFNVTGAATIGSLAGSGTVLFGACPLPKYTTITCDGNSQISNLKRYTHAVSAGRVAAPFAINGVPFTPVLYNANVSAGNGRGGFKFTGFTWNTSLDQFPGKAHERGVPYADDLTQLLTTLALGGDAPCKVEAFDLTPGRWYSLRIYELMFDGGPRDAYLTFNPDNNGPMTCVYYDAQGDRTSPSFIEYVFCANDAGTVEFSYVSPAERGTTGSRWHFYGFSIEETSPAAGGSLTLTANDGSFAGKVLNGTIAGQTLKWKGGSGTWNATDANWLDAGGHETTWKNGATAVFAGNAGTVTVDGDVAGLISFQTNGYTVAGSFGARPVTVTAAAGTSNAFAAVTSGTFTKEGAGLVALAGAASLTGRVNVNGGMLVAGTDGCLSATADVDVADGAAFQSVAHVTVGHLDGAGALVIGPFPKAAINAFTCDADSGFSTNKTYTHLYDFGASDDGATINGVKLTKVTATSLAATATNGGFSGGPGASTTDFKLSYLQADGITADMGIYDLLRDSRYGSSYTPHLTGLKVGKWHELRLYYTRFESISATGRHGDISFSPLADGTFRDTIAAYQNARPASFVSYKFQPVKDDFAFRAKAVTGGDWLLYGLSVELCDPPLTDASLAVTVRAGREATFAGPIVAAGRLEKSGPGTLRLTHDGTDLGDLTVNAGTVVLPGGGGVVGTLDVKSGATVATEHGTTYANPTMPMKDATATIGTLTGAGTLRLDGKADIVSDRFSLVYVTDDTSSGFSSEKTYTHLMDFGSGGATTVNGVAIPAYATSGGSHPAGAYVGGCMFSYFYDWSTQGGLVNYIANTEGVFNLYRDFTVFPGSGPWALRLYNLKAGRWHEFRWYQRAPVGGGLGTGRVSTYRFDPDGDGPQGVTVTIDQNSYKPHYLAYRFYAATTNCFTLSLYNHSSQNGAHVYGLSCEVIDDPTDAEPGVVSVEKGTFAGAIAGTNDWFKTGTNTLTLSGTSPFAGTAIVSGGTLLAQGAALDAGSVRIDAGGVFGVPRGASASVGGNFTVSDGGTIRYEVERDSRSGAVAVAGDTSLAATGKVDVVSSLAAGKVPSRNALVVTQGETTGPASYDGWTPTLNGGRFPATLEVDNGTFLLRNDVGLIIILR